MYSYRQKLIITESTFLSGFSRHFYQIGFSGQARKLTQEKRIQNFIDKYPHSLLLLSEKQIKLFVVVCVDGDLRINGDEEKSEREKHISITLDEGKKEKEIKSKSASKIMTDYACYLFCSLFPYRLSLYFA